MPPRKRKSKAAVEAARKRARWPKAKPIPPHLYALKPFGCNTVSTEVADSAFFNTTTSSSSSKLNSTFPAFEAAFLTPSHLYTIFSTATDDPQDSEADQSHTQSHLKLAKMCRQTHVWSSCSELPNLQPTIPRCDALQKAVHLPWSNQLVLFFQTSVAVVELNQNHHNQKVHYLNLNSMLELGPLEDHTVTVAIPRLFAEWHAVALDTEAQLLYAQVSLSMLGDFVPRELGIYKLNLAAEGRFERLVLLETEQKALKPALFMTVAEGAEDDDYDDNDKSNKISKACTKKLFIGIKEVHTVFGRTGRRLPDRELMSLSAIIHINLSDLSEWDIISLAAESHQPLQRQIQIGATCVGGQVYLLTASGSVANGAEHILAENRLWQLTLDKFTTDLSSSDKSNLFPLTRLAGPQEQRFPALPVNDFILTSACDEVWILCKNDPSKCQANVLQNCQLSQLSAHLGHSSGLITLFRIPLQLSSLQSLAQEAFLHYRPPAGLIWKPKTVSGNSLPSSFSKQERTVEHIQAFLKRNQLSSQCFNLPV